MIAARNRPTLTLRSHIIATCTFGTLGVPGALTAVLAQRGITTPTPIQATTLPDALSLSLIHT